MNFCLKLVDQGVSKGIFMGEGWIINYCVIYIMMVNLQKLYKNV